MFWLIPLSTLYEYGQYGVCLYILYFKCEITHIRNNYIRTNVQVKQYCKIYRNKPFKPENYQLYRCYILNY